MSSPPHYHHPAAEAPHLLGLEGGLGALHAAGAGRGGSAAAAAAGLGRAARRLLLDAHFASHLLEQRRVRVDGLEELGPAQ
jgi:hypothetical protein